MLDLLRPCANYFVKIFDHRESSADVIRLVIHIISSIFCCKWCVYFKKLSCLCQYCIRGNFRSGFTFANFASQTTQKFSLQYMSIYSNENIRKSRIKLSRISPLSPKSQKYLCAKYMTYTVLYALMKMRYV